MNVIAYDPYINIEKAKEIGIKVVDTLDELLENADYVSLHVPLTEKTKYMIGVKELKKMKKTAFLINCGRGALVKEDDLIKALENGDIAGAGIDVFEKEPPEKDNPLFKMKQVVVTPHSASLTVESMIKMAVGAAEQVVQVLKGEKPKYIVNKDLCK
jgi:D-3-phosphoglycerate dehydrogenase